MAEAGSERERAGVASFPYWLPAVPLLVAATVVVLARSCQPFWLGGSTDPSYPYLANALLLAEGRPPAHTHHPGTTLQLLGAAVLRLFHAVSGSPGPLRLHVLRDPEPFISAILIALLALNTAALTFVGWAAWRLTGNRACAVAAQAGPLAAAAYLHCAILVMCEPLLTALGAVISGTLLLLLLPSHEEGSAGPAARRLGGLAGLAVATKLTALPFVLVPLAFLPSWRSRLRFLAITALVSASILLVLGPRLPSTLKWFLALAVHPGAYAGGAEGLLGGTAFAESLERVASRDWLLLALAGLFLLVALAARRAGLGDDQARREWRGLVALALVLTFCLLLAARSGGVRQYAVPPAAFAGLGLVLAHRLLLRAGQRRWPALALWLAVLGIAAHQGWHLHGIIQRRQEVRPGALEVRARAAQLGLDRLLLSDRASDPAAALSFANDWAGGAFSEDLRRPYPNRVFYNETRLHSFGQPLQAEDLWRSVAADRSYLFWTSAYVPLEICRWILDPRRDTELQRGRDGLVRVAARPPVARPRAGGLPPFVGFLALEGLGRFRLPDAPPAGAVWGAGPATRLAFMGTGDAMSLVVEHELTLDQEQTLVLSLNGAPILRHACSGRGQRELQRLSFSSAPGPNEIRIDYSRLLPAVPADGVQPPAEPALQPTGVLFHRLQITRSHAGQAGSASSPG